MRNKDRKTLNRGQVQKLAESVGRIRDIGNHLSTSHESRTGHVLVVTLGGVNVKIFPSRGSQKAQVPARKRVPETGIKTGVGHRITTPSVLIADPAYRVPRLVTAKVFYWPHCSRS